MSEITIRKYSPEDKSILLHNTLGRYNDDLRGYNKDRLYVAQYNGAVAGWSYASIRSGKGMMSFVIVYVFGDFRCKRIGTALYRDAESRCIAAGSEELFAEYYSNDTLSFISGLDFSYTTSSAIMEYTGGMLPEDRSFIRQYKPDDVICFNRIWSEGMDDMHRRIGRPVSDLSDPSEEIIRQYNEEAKNEYVIEKNGKIVAVGGVSDNMIGCLAVDMKHNNKGYGTRLAIFLTNEILRRGHDRAQLACETGNDNTRHVYEKIGYRELYTVYASIKKL